MIIFEILYDSITLLQFLPLLEYIDEYWLGTVGAAEFSVFRAPCRTNNSVESWHAELKEEVGPHPSTWNLIGAILRRID